MISRISQIYDRSTSFLSHQIPTHSCTFLKSTESPRPGRASAITIPAPRRNARAPGTGLNIQNPAYIYINSTDETAPSDGSSSPAVWERKIATGTNASPNTRFARKTRSHAHWRHAHWRLQWKATHGNNCTICPQRRSRRRTRTQRILFRFHQH